jgi:hypothetical protein
MYLAGKHDVRQLGLLLTAGACQFCRQHVKRPLDSRPTEQARLRERLQLGAPSGLFGRLMRAKPELRLGATRGVV